MNEQTKTDNVTPEVIAKTFVKMNLALENTIGNAQKLDEYIAKIEQAIQPKILEDYFLEVHQLDIFFGMSKRSILT